MAQTHRVETAEASAIFEQSQRRLQAAGCLFHQMGCWAWRAKQTENREISCRNDERLVAGLSVYSLH